MSYHNPLHTPPSTSQRSQYNSLSGAQPASSHASKSRTLFPHRKMIPLQLPQTNAMWNAAMRGAPISQVSFDYPGYAGQGVPVRELASRAVPALMQMIANPADSITMLIPGVKTGTGTFKICWPGYEHVDWTRPISLAGPDGRPINRAQLAASVSQSLGRFFEKTQYEATRDAQYSIGSKSPINIGSLILVSIVQMYEGVWMAEVGYDTRTQ